MSKQLTISATASVVAMALFAIAMSGGESVHRAQTETGAKAQAFAPVLFDNSLID